eukprot:PhF_6_TR15957/c0_g1_i2/m.24869
MVKERVLQEVAVPYVLAAPPPIVVAHALSPESHVEFVLRVSTAALVPPNVQPTQILAQATEHAEKVNQEQVSVCVTQDMQQVIAVSHAQAVRPTHAPFAELAQ